MHAIDFLYEHLGAKMAAEFNRTASETGDSCACCNRPASQWATPSQRVVGESYGKPEVHCLSCHTLYHPSFKHLGQEGLRGGKTPTAHKLGMLSGCGALITPGHSVLYAPGKYYDKFLSAPSLIFDEVLPIGGKDADQDALSRNASPPLLYIKNFGKVKAKLLSSLVVTQSDRSIVFCDGGDGSSLDVPRSLLDFARDLSDSPKPKKWLELFRASTRRYLREAEALELHEASTPAMQARLANEYPEDPYWRLGASRILEALIA